MIIRRSYWLIICQFNKSYLLSDLKELNVIWIKFIIKCWDKLIFFIYLYDDLVIDIDLVQLYIKLIE